MARLYGQKPRKDKNFGQMFIRNQKDFGVQNAIGKKILK